MAKGYPDFFGQSVFLKYGGAQETGGITTVPAGATTTLVTVTGKGVLYNTHVLSHEADTLETNVIAHYVNNVIISNGDWLGFLRHAQFGFMIGEPVLQIFNKTKPYYSLMLFGPISFDVSVHITYTNDGAADVDVGAFITAALVV